MWTRTTAGPSDPVGLRAARIAYTRQELPNRENPANATVEARPVVCDPDGKNPKTVRSATGKGWTFAIGSVDGW